MAKVPEEPITSSSPEEIAREKGSKESIIREEDEVFDPRQETRQPNKWSSIVQIGLAAVIAFAMVFVMVPRLAPSKAAYQADITRLELDLVSIFNTLASEDEIPDLAGLAEQVEVDTIHGKVTEQTGAINTLKAQIADWETRIAELEANPVGEVETYSSSSLDYWLTESQGYYWLHILSSRNSTVVARIMLICTEPYELATNGTIAEAHKEFDSKFLGRGFTPELKWNGEVWEVTSAAFYTGSITLKQGEKWSDFIRPFETPVGYSYRVCAELLSGASGTEEPETGGI